MYIRECTGLFVSARVFNVFNEYTSESRYLEVSKDQRKRKFDESKLRVTEVVSWKYWTVGTEKKKKKNQHPVISIYWNSRWHGSTVHQYYRSVREHGCASVRSWVNISRRTTNKQQRRDTVARREKRCTGYAFRTKCPSKRTELSNSLSARKTYGSCGVRRRPKTKIRALLHRTGRGWTGDDEKLFGKTHLPFCRPRRCW